MASPSPSPLAAGEAIGFVDQLIARFQTSSIHSGSAPRLKVLSSAAAIRLFSPKGHCMLESVRKFRVFYEFNSHQETNLPNVILKFAALSSEQEEALVFHTGVQEMKMTVVIRLASKELESARLSKRCSHGFCCMISISAVGGYPGLLLLLVIHHIGLRLQMAEAYVAVAGKIVVSAAVNDVGTLVDELLGLAFSVRRCRAKCEDLANKVQNVHRAIVDLEAHPERYDTQDYQSNASKFKCVIQDCISLVKKYNTKNWLVRALLSLKLEGEFECLDQRLEQCVRFFKLDLQMDTRANIDDMRSEIREDVRQTKETLEEVRRLVAAKSSPADGSAFPGTIDCVEPIYEGYLLGGRMVSLSGSDLVLLFSSQHANNEVAIMKLVSDCEYIMRFFGIWSQGGNSYNVMERPGTEVITLDERIKLDHGLTRPLLRNDWRLKRQLALDIATGLGYLHCGGILHRKLRSPYIFLTDELRPKIFGLFEARMKVKPSEKKWTGVEQIRWAAPEMLPRTRPEYTEKCDIFSLGVILWEIITDDYPFSHIDSAMVLMKKRTSASESCKLSFPTVDDVSIPEFYKEFVQVASDCMEDLPEKRPGIDQVIDRLTKLAPEQMLLA
ncbi:hypothetical protein R1sor_023913 [Riccia sorocarpa]|uniref:Protein kinase domain-containing protein n=1 Tax=Riccia sorocarpa TaxID=122646 RepID=A0ABD3GP19_9MARC